MKKFTLGEKLNGIAYLQGYKDNPYLYEFLHINGHQGIDITRADGDPLPAYYDGTVVHIQYDAIVYLTDPDENKMCLEISIAHGKNQRVKVGDRIKKGDIICDQSTVGPSVGWGEEDYDRIAWSHEHIAFRYAKRVDAKVQQDLIWNYRQSSPIDYVIIEGDKGMDHFIDPKQHNNRVLFQFAKAMQRKEGWMDGTKSFRHNNPGNIKGLDGKFLVFKTYEDGFYALCDYIERAITGRHKAYLKWGYGMTILQFCKTYAPTADQNNPTKYAQDLVQWVGLKDINQPMTDILLTEIDYIKKYNNLEHGLVPHRKEQAIYTPEQEKVEDLQIQMNPITKFVLYLFNKYFKI